MKIGKHDYGKYLSRNVNKEFSEQLTFGQQVADNVASFGGSWPFIFIFLFAISFWTFFQTIIAHNKGFDPYPYILLNLILSCLAAIQAPVIIMSQNRQAQKDRIRADNDFEINLKAEKEIEHVQEELDAIREGQNLNILKSLDEVKASLAQINQDIQKMISG